MPTVTPSVLVLPEEEEEDASTPSSTLGVVVVTYIGASQFSNLMVGWLSPLVHLANSSNHVTTYLNLKVPAILESLRKRTLAATLRVSGNEVGPRPGGHGHFHNFTIQATAKSEEKIHGTSFMLGVIGT